MYPDGNYEPSGKVLPCILSGKGHGVSNEIEAQLEATARVWQTLQRQIQRGEDHYVEESGSFNIYKGWDGFIDARLFETMPKRFDHRWFSSSFSHTPSHQPWPPAPSTSEADSSKPAQLSGSTALVVDTILEPVDQGGFTAVPSKRKRAR